MAGFDIGNQTLEGGTAIDGQTAFSFVGVGADDLYVVLVGELLDLVRLVVRRVIFMLGGHAYVLGGAEIGY